MILRISYAIGNRDGNMGSGGDYLNPNTVSSGYYPNFPWYSTGGSFYRQGNSLLSGEFSELKSQELMFCP